MPDKYASLFYRCVALSERSVSDCCRLVEEVPATNHALDDAVLFYGLSVYLEKLGENAEVEHDIDKVLEQESVWPCISYLAAWNDRNIKQKKFPLVFV